MIFLSYLPMAIFVLSMFLMFIGWICRVASLCYQTDYRLKYKKIWLKKSGVNLCGLGMGGILVFLPIYLFTHILMIDLGVTTVPFLYQWFEGGSRSMFWVSLMLAISVFLSILCIYSDK